MEIDADARHEGTAPLFQKYAGDFMAVFSAGHAPAGEFFGWLEQIIGPFQQDRASFLHKGFCKKAADGGGRRKGREGRLHGQAQCGIDIAFRGRPGPAHLASARALAEDEDGRPFGEKAELGQSFGDIET